MEIEYNLFVILKFATLILLFIVVAILIVSQFKKKNK